MKLFSCYIKKSKNNQIEDLIIIKNNFSYLAFCFNSMWFLYHKMWKDFCLISVTNILIILILQHSFFIISDAIIIELGFLLMIGLNATHLYERHLVKDNYRFVGNIFGHNKYEAKINFASQLFEAEGYDQNHSYSADS